MPDLRIDNLTFTYPGLLEPALRSISLEIREGEFALVTGPSGCGKSTLALTLAGLIPSRISGHMRGNVFLGDQSVSDMEVYQASQHIGIVFQNPDNQLVQLTVEEEVAFGPENLGLPSDEIERRVVEALTYTGMLDLRTEQIYALSGGQKQRVAIAATLAMRPQVLALDEPTSDLDPLGTQETLSVLRDLNKRYGMTIVLVEHKVDEVIGWVDRVILMDRGAIARDGAPGVVFRDVALWEELGVSVPQMALVARALPDVFGDHGNLPVTIDAVYDALRATRYAQTLRAQATRLGATPALRIVSARASDAQDALRWEQVDLAYGAKQVLRAIDLAIQPEEWVAIIGPNGSGKTSLASLAMGFQPPTKGVVRYRGRPVVAGAISQQAQHIAYLFQAADTMLFGATVERELRFGVRRPRKGQGDPSLAIDNLLAITDLTAYRQTNPFHLSHGQRKRLAIGALLARNPDLLILDEPTTGQDEGHARAFLQFLGQLRERGRYTYVMITHDMRAAARYASRVVALRDGRVALDGPPERVFAQTEALAACGILAPPITQLHARLCDGAAAQVALNVPDFLRALGAAEATASVAPHAAATADMTTANVAQGTAATMQVEARS